MISIDTEGKQEIFNFLSFIREEGTLDMTHSPRFVSLRFGIDLTDAEDLYFEWAESANYI